MRYVRFASLLVLIICAFSVCVCAEPDSTADTVPVEDVPVEAAPTIPVVALDPDTVQAIADAVLPSESIEEDSSEVTIPVVDLSPDTLDAISQAVEQALADSSAPEVPVNFSTEYTDGYYFICDCVLGEDLKIYVPVEFSVGSFAISDTGALTNMTLKSFETTVRIGHKSYTVKASSMGGLMYSENKFLGGGTIEFFDLNENVKESNISFLHNTPQAVPNSTYWIVLISIIIILGCLFCFIWRR